MIRFFLSCLWAMLISAAHTGVSPSMLGATVLKCSQEELLQLELRALSGSDGVSPVASKGVGLKAAIFNIRSGFGPENDREPARVRARLTQIASALLTTGAPDVIGLNEVDFRSRRTDFVDQAQFIAEKLAHAGFRYSVVRGPTWLRDESGREIRYGNALLVRHPIVQTRHCSFARFADCDALPTVDNLPQRSLSAPWSWLSHEPRGVAVVDFHWRGRTVRAIVTHLDPFSAQLREMQAAQIIAGLVPLDSPVVLLGDMNSVPTRLTLDRTWFSADRTHDVLTSGRLFDARSEMGRDDSRNSNRWATYPEDDPRWPLDGIFATADLAPVDLQVVGPGLSDHLGLVGTLVPITDTALLSTRLERLALRREQRFARLQRCDLPDVGRASFFSWLRDVTAFAGSADATASTTSSHPR